MKKFFCIILAVVMISVLVAACTDEDNVEDEPVDTGIVNEDPGTLSIAIVEDGLARSFWEAVAALFEEETGIAVTLQIGPDVGSIVRSQIDIGNVPDFISSNNSDSSGLISSLVEDRGLLNLTSVFDGPQYDSSQSLRSKLIPGFLASSSSAPYYGDSGIYLAPGSSSPSGLIYNMTLFARLSWNVPVTWDDYFALGERANAEGIALQTYQGIYPVYLSNILFPALASALGDDYAKIENLTSGIWTDPRTIAVLEQFERIYAGGFLLRGTSGMSSADSQAAHLMDQAAFIPGGVKVVAEMAAAERTAGFRYGLIPPPQMDSGDTRFIAASVEQMAIPSAAQNAENAKQFLRFLYTDRVIMLYAQLISGTAIMPAVNALDVAQSFILEDTYEMFDAFYQPGVVPIAISLKSPPAGSAINVNDAWQYGMSEVMTGRMTAGQWGEYMDQVYADIAVGR